MVARDGALAAFLALTEESGGTWTHAQQFVDDINNVNDAVNRFHQ